MYVTYRVRYVVLKANSHVPIHFVTVLEHSTTQVRVQISCPLGHHSKFLWRYHLCYLLLSWPLVFSF